MSDEGATEVPEAWAPVFYWLQTAHPLHLNHH